MFKAIVRVYTKFWMSYERLTFVQFRLCVHDVFMKNKTFIYGSSL